MNQNEYITQIIAIKVTYIIIQAGINGKMALYEYHYFPVMIIFEFIIFFLAFQKMYFETVFVLLQKIVFTLFNHTRHTKVKLQKNEMV